MQNADCTIQYSAIHTGRSLRPVYSDTTQLDVEWSWVELRRQSVYSDADATQLIWPASRWLAVSCSTASVALPIIGDSWVASVRVSISTQLNSIRRVESSCVGEVSIATHWRNSTQLDVELSCVAINGPLVSTRLLSLASRYVYHSLANRHSSSTPAEMQDRKCFSL